MEFLLINHPLACPICDQGGECDLQDQAMAYGRGNSRFHENKRAVTDKYMGPLIKTTMTRCIHCTRCVRFAEEVAGVEEIGALYRGEDMQITSYLERAVTSEMSGNVIDLCPVGALTAKPIAYHYRSWELKRTDGIDVTDAVGSNIEIHSRLADVVRITPRLNDDVNEEWISDRARFLGDGLRERRLDRPWVRSEGRLRPASWSEAFAAVVAAAREAAGSIAALAGDLAAVEDMVALKDLVFGLGGGQLESRLDGSMVGGSRGRWLFNSGLAGSAAADVLLLVGANPRVDAPVLNTRLRHAVRKRGARVFRIGPGADLSYPVADLGDELGLLSDLPSDLRDALAGAQRPAILIASAVASAEVLAAAEALVAAHGLVRDGWNGFNIVHTAASRVGALDIGFAGPGIGALAAAPPRLLFLLGVDEIDLAPFASSYKVYVGSHGDAGAAAADVILPGAAWTEKNGTYVNMEGRVQRSLRAIFPPGDAREEWTIFRALGQMADVALGYDSLDQLRARIAREWPHLAREERAIAPWEPALSTAVAPPSGPVRRPPADFYRSNPIARASATMAACVREIVRGQRPTLEAAE
jgi:NADH-quinone oxidoreductase subunit G